MAYPDRTIRILLHSLSACHAGDGNGGAFGRAIVAVWLTAMTLSWHGLAGPAHPAAACPLSMLRDGAMRNPIAYLRLRPLAAYRQSYGHESFAVMQNTEFSALQ